MAKPVTTSTDPEKNANYRVGEARAAVIEPEIFPDPPNPQPPGSGRGPRRRGGAVIGGIPRLYNVKSRKSIEASAIRIANLVLAKELNPQEAHAVLHALRLIFDSMKLTEEFEAEYRLKEVADQMAEMRETNQALYQRLVELGVAPALESQKLLT